MMKVSSDYYQSCKHAYIQSISMFTTNGFGFVQLIPIIYVCVVCLRFPFFQTRPSPKAGELPYMYDQHTLTF